MLEGLSWFFISSKGHILKWQQTVRACGFTGIWMLLLLLFVLYRWVSKNSLWPNGAALDSAACGLKSSGRSCLDLLNIFSAVGASKTAECHFLESNDSLSHSLTVSQMWNGEEGWPLSRESHFRALFIGISDHQSTQEPPDVQHSTTHR